MPGSKPVATIEIGTEHLRLWALSLEQLSNCLEDPERLEQELGFPVDADLITAPVQRAIGLKVDKMSQVAPEAHPWLTYWLMVTAAEPCGVGLIGFKGEPDQQGAVEIGYGIVPAHRSQGYTTEAARALIAWAFQDPACRSVVADPKRDNLASNRVLAKVGMHVFHETEDTLRWRVDRENHATRCHDGERTTDSDSCG